MAHKLTSSTIKYRSYGLRAPSVRVVHQPSPYVYKHDKLLEKLDRLVANRRKPGEGNEASICFGGEAEFTEPPSLRIQLKTTGEEETPENVIEYTEVEGSRKTTTVRVENPEDSEQYVMVKRIEQIDFSSSEDSKIRRFILKNDV